MLFEDITKGKKYAPKESYKIPEYITDNLRYSLFAWQQEAIENFLLNEFQRKNDNINTPNHLMFNMATGSGKTLVMAALILYYYKQGLNKFIFFVNQNEIVGKTQANFLDKNHSKYLFKENIVINGQIVNIQEVEQFSSYKGIQIKFTTVQQLHNDIYKESEDSLVLSDLQKKDIVLIGDEAHHLNATTKKKTKQSEQVELDGSDHTFIAELTNKSSLEDIEKSWETTICHHILNKSCKGTGLNKNALLEFTATIPNDESVQKKYEDKVIIQFDVKEFIKAGFTKHIKLLRSNLEKNERILQALFLNWYRYRLALELELSNFKPVILFRNKTIDESKNDYSFFCALVERLTENDFSFISSLEQFKENQLQNDLPNVYKDDGQIFKKIVSYMKENNFSFTEVVSYIKENFRERNCIITNSKMNKTKSEKLDSELGTLLNSLESKDNHIRAIFTVKKLTEGWDVLNLYDIVRLNHGRDTDYKKGKVGESTTSEVQLIGRGIRYYPFSYIDKDKRQRKFDDDLQNKYRVLEEFYFHSDGDERYISDLSIALKNSNLIDNSRVHKSFSVKNEFVDDFKNLYLFVNKKIENPNRRLKEIPKDLQNLQIEYKIVTGYAEVRSVNIEDTKNDNVLNISSNKGYKSEYCRFKELESRGYSRHIFYKAVHKLTTNPNSYFSFENLSARFNINSIEEFYFFLGNIQVQLYYSYQHFEDIPKKELLYFTEYFLNCCQNEFEQYDYEFKGTDFTLEKFENCFSFTKEKMIEQKNLDENYSTEIKLRNAQWYAIDSFCGTAEERNLVDFIESHLSELQQKYAKIMLLRNEEVYKIFDFKTGQGFCPDFLLLLSNKEDKISSYYQVFIEPKGEHLKETDKWKEKFLLDITKKYGFKNKIQINPNIIESNEYILIGLPFFNENGIEMRIKFNEEFNNLL